jgi:hypothetical protein
MKSGCAFKLAISRFMRIDGFSLSEIRVPKLKVPMAGLEPARAFKSPTDFKSVGFPRRASPVSTLHHRLDTVQKSQHDIVIVAAFASLVVVLASLVQIHQKGYNTHNAAYHCDAINDDLPVIHLVRR